PLPLRPIVDLPDQFGQGRVRGHLGLAAGPAPQHVRDEDVHVAVAVHVGKIDRHGGVAGGAERQAGRGAECPVAVVQPEQVRVLGMLPAWEASPASAVRSVNTPCPSLRKSATPPPRVLTSRSRSPSPSTSANTAPVECRPVRVTPARAVMSSKRQSPRFLYRAFAPWLLVR